MTPLVWPKNAISPRLLCYATVILAFHHCTGSQQSASRGRVLAFYRISPCLYAFYPSPIIAVIFLYQPLFQLDIWPHHSLNLGSFGHLPQFFPHPSAILNVFGQVISIMIRIIMFHSTMIRAMHWCEHFHIETMFHSWSDLLSFSLVWTQL